MSYGSALRKLASFRSHWKANGIYETMRTYLMMNGWYKEGKIVGKDKFGNVYYEAADHPIHGRDRWVEYADKSDWDGSEVPAEWHMWLTHMHDGLPKDEAGASGASFQWKKEHLKNVGSRYGSSANYLPPSHWHRGEKTYKQDKVEGWTPK
ncbi:hypothetical protein AAMO2058_000296200 [Amorphochlora amoebiformis]|mmetsp:Transcript_5569/g.8501  ORF Transcript_5569/g.8501 Transcript_5569/m.8501 type:complete len:151 (-) Transcript_5569:152-604(-)|eukprot:148123-Amorphochlora_amoeboformis.AAC.1